MCVPHHHDLPEWSCVNREVKAFNRKLVKLMKPYKHVTVVKVDLDRKFFTRQGVHMNILRKEKIAFKIASVVMEIFWKKEEIISLYWKNEYKVNASDSSNEDNIILQEDPKATPSTTVSVKAVTDDAAQDEPIYKGPRTSKRQKKSPAIKNDDFLMVKDNQMSSSN